MGIAWFMLHAVLLLAVGGATGAVMSAKIDLTRRGTCIENLEILVDTADRLVKFTISGAQQEWVGLGFGAADPKEAYTIAIVGLQGSVSEYRKGIALPKQAEGMSVVVGGKRRALVTRGMAGATLAHYSFTVATEYDLILICGTGEEYGIEKRKEYLNLTLPFVYSPIDQYWSSPEYRDTPVYDRSPQGQHSLTPLGQYAATPQGVTEKSPSWIYRSTPHGQTPLGGYQLTPAWDASPEYQALVWPTPQAAPQNAPEMPQPSRTMTSIRTPTVTLLPVEDTPAVADSPNAIALASPEYKSTSPLHQNSSVSPRELTRTMTPTLLLPRLASTVSDDDGIPIWVWGVVAGAVVAIIIALVVVLLCFRRQKRVKFNQSGACAEPLLPEADTYGSTAQPGAQHFPDANTATSAPPPEEPLRPSGSDHNGEGSAGVSRGLTSPITGPEPVVVPLSFRPTRKLRGSTRQAGDQGPSLDVELAGVSFQPTSNAPHTPAASIPPFAREDPAPLAASHAEDATSPSLYPSTFSNAFPPTPNKSTASPPITLRLDLPGPESFNTAAFTESVARGLGVPPSKVEVLSVRAGSVIVTFRLRDIPEEQAFDLAHRIVATATTRPPGDPLSEIFTHQYPCLDASLSSPQTFLLHPPHPSSVASASPSAPSAPSPLAAPPALRAFAPSKDAYGRDYDEYSTIISAVPIPLPPPWLRREPTSPPTRHSAIPSVSPPQQGKGKITVRVCVPDEAPVRNAQEVVTAKPVHTAPGRVEPRAFDRSPWYRGDGSTPSLPSPSPCGDEGVPEVEIHHEDGTVEVVSCVFPA